MRVLILESSGSRGCLAAARSLAAAGHRVDVGHPPGHSLAARSPAVRTVVTLPSLRDGAQAYLQAVEQHVAQEHYDAVMGAGDAEVMALSSLRDRLGAPVLHPAPDVLRAAIDKQAVHDAARAEGLASPSATVFTGVKDLRACLQTGPVVVKPRLHWDSGGSVRPLRLEAQLAHTEVEALRLVDDITRADGEAVLQEFVSGQLMSYIVLLDENARIIAHCQQRTVHTFPEPMGVSARAVTSPIEAEVVDESLRMLRRLGLTGLVQLQYILDERRKRRLVIDVNPRIYGSIQLAIAAGADFPRLWVEAARGARPDSAPIVAARPGVRYQWLEGDLRRSLGRRSVLDAVGSLVAAPRSAHSVLSLRDLGPAWGQGRELCRRAVARAARP